MSEPPNDVGGNFGHRGYGFRARAAFAARPGTTRSRSLHIRARGGALSPSSFRGARNAREPGTHNHDCQLEVPERGSSLPAAIASTGAMGSGLGAFAPPRNDVLAD